MLAEQHDAEDRHLHGLRLVERGRDENERACIAASSRAVPAICAMAPPPVYARNALVGAGTPLPATAAASARNTAANGKP